MAIQDKYPVLNKYLEEEVQGFELVVAATMLAMYRKDADDIIDLAKILATEYYKETMEMTDNMSAVAMIFKKMSEGDDFHG